MDRSTTQGPLAFLGDRIEFPPVEHAREDGLLAVGGDLSPARLLLAYRQGIFPWFSPGEPILWWSPDPRMVLFPPKLRISKSMRRLLRDRAFVLTRDQCFDRVVEACARVVRQGQEGTWIGKEVREAYGALHRLGHAHSYEAWENGKLVGGLYGVDLDGVFCGESMFSLRPNASKFAFISMVGELHRRAYRLIDCQVHTRHLESLGAELISRNAFLGFLQGDLGGGEHQQNGAG